MAKARKKQAMGRGLSAILNTKDIEVVNTAEDKDADKLVGSIIDIPLESIEVNPFQPRTHFEQEALEELANSIKELGIIQPITVNKIGANNFQIVSGERRFRASKLIGLKTIPAYIRILNDQAMLEMALVENIQRQDLDPIEVALSYQRLIDEIKLTQEELSVRVGKKRSTVTNYLRLLKLDPIIQSGMRDRFISMGHGRALISITNLDEQLDIYKRIVDNRLSVRETEEIVQSKKKMKNTIPTAKTPMPSFVKESAERFSDFFGNKTNVTFSKNGKGKISIPFSSEKDLERIKKLLE